MTIRFVITLVPASACAPAWAAVGTPQVAISSQNNILGRNDTLRLYVDTSSPGLTDIKNFGKCPVFPVTK